jgi:pyruvate/2-oxoacid:ferredoxin oxidoreductase alpha subunit
MESTRPPVRSTEAARIRRGTMVLADALDAAIRTEALCAKALWAPLLSVRDGKNAFGDAPKKLGDDPKQAAAAIEACAKAEGRAAAIVSLASLVDARRALASLVERRCPLVIHAIIRLPGDAPSPSAHADLHALGDLGVAVLYARDAQDAADLTVIAHRAAEDAETPVVIVHDGFPASFARDRIVLPDGPMIRAALEPAPSPLGPQSDNQAPHRRAAARIPFALASAMRAFERYSGRRVHAVEAVGTEGADVVLVATGAVSETARATVEHLRTNGNDPHLGVVQVLALRPFPGAEIVKAVGRARGVAVIERHDAPLAQSNELATEVKAAFADALTWAPGYPGIGRIPTIFAACIDPSAREASPGELFAVVENALQGEQGKRAFRVGGGSDASPAHRRSVAPEQSVSLRWCGDPSLLLDLVVDVYGGHVRATPVHPGEKDELYDITFSHLPVRAHHGASHLDLVVLQGRADEADAIAQLRDGGVALVIGRELPSAHKAALKGTRVMSIDPGKTDDRARQALLTGAVLRAVPPAEFERTQLLADVDRAIRSATSDDQDARALIEAVGRGYESTTELS